jgi:plasmid stabilization system protein ParE
MTRAVVWSRDALDDLAEAAEYVTAADPERALSLIARIDAACVALGRHPSGRPGRVHGTFEKSLPRLRYIIAYSLDGDDQLTILRIVHTSRDWPAGGWPS